MEKKGGGTHVFQDESLGRRIPLLEDHKKLMRGKKNGKSLWGW